MVHPIENKVGFFIVNSIAKTFEMQCKIFFFWQIKISEYRLLSRFQIVLSYEADLIRAFRIEISTNTTKFESLNWNNQVYDSLVQALKHNMEFFYDVKIIAGFKLFMNPTCSIKHIKISVTYVGKRSVFLNKIKRIFL